MVVAKNVSWNALEMETIDLTFFLLLKLVVQGYVFRNILSMS
jgi:hypothetical protein